ncbi:MAG: hypothetical protein JJ895_00420 [Balneolaceae bacterium]|nr:hypothetical protein [Balneolaceae bacterium]
MNKFFKKSVFLLGIYVLVVQCEKSPEGIYNALFDDIAAEDIALSLSMNVTKDIQLHGDSAKENNSMANWGELIYFEAKIGNPLPESVSDVELEIVGVNNASHIVDWHNRRLDYDVINPFTSSNPDEYLCLLCGELNEVYLGHTWVEITETNFGTSSITLDIQISFDFRETEYTQETTHTFTIFP